MARESIATRKAKHGHLLERDHTLNGGIVVGLNGHFIEVQARAMEVLSKPHRLSEVTTITGMTSRAVDESLQRIGGALAKLRMTESDVSVLINLAPAELPKDGTWLDLPLAVIMLQAAGILPDLPEYKEGDFVLLGEVGLHGEIRRVPGALSLAYIAKAGQALIVPAGNEKECALILAKSGHEGCTVSAVSTLEEVVNFFKGKGRLENALKQTINFESAVASATDFGLVRGQERAKQAAVIAAAGGHNLLLIGPPGEGKSMIASAIPGILPPLTNHEKVELTRIYSACGELTRDGMAVTRRPVRTVHHTASKQALIGGGSRIPKPGEVTLAHLGVLFLDEIAEFNGATLESLRQPMESGVVNISRVGALLEFPSRFTLVAAMNPCPCGYYGTDRCTCRESDVARYQKKISGPLLDRIDLQVELKPLSVEEKFADAEPNQSAKFRSAVASARAVQQKRFEGTSIPFNAAIPGGKVRETCAFSEPAFAKYREVIAENTLSSRSTDRLAKVARTVADLAGEEQIQPKHLEKAASFVVGGMLRDK